MRSKEEALLLEDGKSLCVTAMVACVGIPEVSNSMFCNG